MTMVKQKSKISKTKNTMQARGITLIALVITIVILIILATVAINFVFGEDGLIARAQQSAELTKVESIKEQMQLAKADVAMENGGKVEVDDFFEKLEENGVIGNVENDVIDNGDGTYDIVTDEGYEFEVTVTPDGNIEIEYTGKGEAPRISNINITKTTNSVTVIVETKNVEAGKFTYSYKKNSDGEESWQEVEIETTSNTCTISNLQSNEIYNIKVKVETDKGTVEKTINIQLGEMPQGKVNFDDYVWQGDETANITINTTETGYTLQYQIVSAGGGMPEDNSWIDTTSGAIITDLKYGDTVYGRLWDGTNESDYANATIEDKIAPEGANISLSATNTTTDETIIATITLTDGQSGASVTESKWVYNTTSENIGIEESSYSNSFTTNPEEITLQATTVGTYYLHVLTKDMAGNKVETVSKGVTVEEPINPIEEIKGDIQTETVKIEKVKVSSEGKETGTIYVPGGYGIASDSPDNIDEGIVITNKDNTNEFVWVPVSSEELEEMYVVAENTKLNTALGATAVTTNVYSRLRSEEDGSLIDATDTEPGTRDSREPDILPETDNGDANSTYLSKIRSVFAEDLKEYNISSGSSNAQVLRAYAQMLVDDYQKTYESVKEYGGFYVGRYEISGTLSAPTVKRGGTVSLYEDVYSMRKACDNIEDSTYAKSEMIYGNQWDRVLNWIIETGGKTADEVYKDSSSWGNYSNYNEENSDKQVNDAGERVLPSGSSEYWKANNIYDLAGNAYECTQEVDFTCFCTFRGGNYEGNGKYSQSAIRMTSFPFLTDTFVPEYVIDSYSARAILYIK